MHRWRIPRLCSCDSFGYHCICMLLHMAQACGRRKFLDNGAIWVWLSVAKRVMSTFGYSVGRDGWHLCHLDLEADCFVGGDSWMRANREVSGGLRAGEAVFLELAKMSSNSNLGMCLCEVLFIIVIDRLTMARSELRVTFGV